MKFFSRKFGARGLATDTVKNQAAQRIVHREIEMKVERTWTTTSARAPGGEPQQERSQTMRHDEGSR